MFTGIVQGLGIVQQQRGSLLEVGTPPAIGGQLEPGASIAVNGSCLTVRKLTKEAFQVDLSQETISRTNLGGLRIGMRVNLELPVAVGDGLDGHLVLGHVDAVGKVGAIEGGSDGDKGKLFLFTYPPRFSRYLVEKGSVAIDGVSLTPYRVTDETFRCSVVPQTLQGTNLQDRAVGHRVNIEFDILAKYVGEMVSRVR